MINFKSDHKRTRKTWNFKPKKKRSEKIIKSTTDENNNNNLPNKTPAAILYDLLSKAGKWPVYEIVAENLKAPRFTCRVSCEEKSAEGGGRSKKIAKQAAAEAFIYNLIYKVIETSSPANPESEPKKSNLNLDRLIDQGNFVGVLQEFCRRWNMPNPIYRLDMEIGSPHSKQYFISCALHDRRTFGSARRKKVAKQTAAEEMWAKVQSDMG